MKAKLFFSIVVLVSVVPGALAAGNQGETNVHTGSSQLPVNPVEQGASTNVQTGPGVVTNDPKQASKDFDATLIAITEKFCGTLAAIADAIKRGELTTDQGREISAQRYQLVQMQFELVSLWRAMEEQDSAKIPSVEANPNLREENEAVVVALPFSSLQLKPSMSEYLGLTPSQIDAIHQVMVREGHRLEPLITQLRMAREKFLAIGSEHMSESEMKSLADTEASALGKLIVANARMQSKIYKVLSPCQQKNSVTSNERRASKGAITVKYPGTEVLVPARFLPNTGVVIPSQEGCASCLSESPISAAAYKKNMIRRSSPR